MKSRQALKHVSSVTTTMGPCNAFTVRVAGPDGERLVDRVVRDSFSRTLVGHVARRRGGARWDARGERGGEQHERQARQEWNGHHEAHA